MRWCATPDGRDDPLQDRAVRLRRGHLHRPAPDGYGACHCEMCRRWCGGVWMGVACDKVLAIDGPVGEWTSSKIATRGFCIRCGSSIWHKPRHTRKFTFGQGLFDDQAGWQLE